VPDVTHLPLLLVEGEGAAADTLIGHFARGNPHWRRLAEAGRAVAVFAGAESYVSPNWYASKAEHGKVVPTWNYAVVHVHATLSPVHEPEAVLEILERLTHRHEAQQIHPWQVSDAPADFTHKLLSHIVGVRFDIRRMQGKWKVSQNQPEANRSSVVAELLQHGGGANVAMAELVRQR